MSSRNGYDIPLTPERLLGLELLQARVQNETTMRAKLIRMLNQEEMDIDRECKYPSTLTIHNFTHIYKREGVGTRIVNVYPEESWAMAPDIYETEDLKDETDFEKAWLDLDERLNIIASLQLADELSGIGRFGIILMGFNDGKDLQYPVAGIRNDGTRDRRFGPLQLLYLRPLAETHVIVDRLETDRNNPRFGQPVMYKVRLSESENGVSNLEAESFGEVAVHWTRILHVADNRRFSPVFGEPRMELVFNRIFDLRKVLGGDGEGFWRGGFPGLSIETHPSIEYPEIDVEKTRDELKAYQEGFQRFLLMEGLTAKSLAPQVTDPTPHFRMQLELIALSLGVPLRVFLGSEEAKLASSQDMRTWNKRLSRRHRYYINPYIIKPFINTMILYGVLPQPQKLIIKWPDLNAPTENDRAVTAAKVTEALTKYVTGNVHILIPPREYLHIVLGYPLDIVEKVLEAAGDRLGELKDITKSTTEPPDSREENVDDKALPD